MATTLDRIIEKKQASEGGEKNTSLDRFLSKRSVDWGKIDDVFAKNDRLRSIKSSEEQALNSLRESVNLQEDNGGGIVSFIARSTKNTARDLFFRQKQDAEYLKQIESNNKTIADILRLKRERPEKNDEYNIMLSALQEKNNILTQATGGSLKDKTSLQLAGQSLGTATEIVPTLGAGITRKGAEVVAKGGQSLAWSLAREGVAFGTIGGAGEVLEKQETKPADILGTVASNIAISTIANLGLGKLAEKLTNFLGGAKVKFTPKEKDLLAENVPQLNEEKFFQDAGIEPPTKATEEDLFAKTIAATEDEGKISELIAGKVPESEIPSVSRALRAITDPDEVANILDEYNPEKALDDIALRVASTDNERKIANLISDFIDERDITSVARVLRKMTDENEIRKVLDAYRAPKEKVLPSNKIDNEPSVAVNEGGDISIGDIGDELGFGPERKPLSISRKIPADEKTQEKVSEVLQELEVSEAGQRIVIGTGIDRNVVAIPSTFPSWVPSELRSTKLFEVVKEHLNDGTVPKTARIRRLYDVIHNEVRRRNGLPQAAEFTDEVSEKTTRQKVNTKREYASVADNDKKRSEDIKQFLFFNKKLPEETVDGLKNKPVGVEELDGEFDADGNITLYRDGEVIDGKPQSYSLVQTEGQVPVTVNRDDILINFNSKEISELAEKSAKDEAQKAIDLESLQKFQNLETEVLAISRARNVGDTMTGPKTESKLARNTLELAVEQGILEETGDIPELGTMNMREQAAKAVGLMGKDYDEAVRIALGESYPPKGLKTGSVYTAVKLKAITDGDIEMIRKLANSENINAFAREAGQEVKAFDANISRDPVRVLREVMKVRREAANMTDSQVANAVEKEVSSIMKTADEVAEDAEKSVENLIDGIKC